MKEIQIFTVLVVDRCVEIGYFVGLEEGLVSLRVV